VPNRIFAVDELPKTLTGKLLEIPVKRLLMGAPAESVASRDSLANPAALDWFDRSRAEILDALRAPPPQARPS
jgi:acetoacetyl-CoA synthetase